MESPEQSSGSAAGDAALALAKASAAAGVAAGKLGYQLTGKALGESGAAAVFPLLALELAAIGTGFAAYAATDAAWLAAQQSAAAAAAQGAAGWKGFP